MAANDRAVPPVVSTPIGIMGAGTMGAGIAQVAAQAEHPVLLYDARAGAAAHAVRAISEVIGKLVGKGRLSAEQAVDTCARLRPVASLAELRGCGLVVEAIVEDLEAKRELFRGLEDVAAAETVFASNTSSLSITAIAAGLRRPERLGGMHFFNPASLMPLVEIVSGLTTSPETLAMLEATAKAWGKQTVRARSTPGFIVNRIARPFYGEALRLLVEKAADAATLDAIMRDAGGFRMGPFELMDLIGLDVNLAVTQSVFEATFHDARFRPSLLQKELVEANHLGRKTGQGFYRYGADVLSPKPRSVAAATFPSSICLFGDDPLTQVLRERLDAGQHVFERAPAHADGRLAETPQACLYRTDGRSATQRSHDLGQQNLVLVDLVLDPATAKRLAVSAADQASAAALTEMAGLLQAAGFVVSHLDDAPGMALLRTVAMLANEAADAVHQGICTAADCDKAMRLGTNYPRGPLEWADAVGPSTLVCVLDHLHAAYGDSRYRVSPLLRRKGLTSSLFHSP